MGARIVVAALAVLLLGLAVWFLLRDDGGLAETLPAPVAFAHHAAAPKIATAPAAPDSREEVIVDEPDVPDEDAPSRPAVRHVPGQGFIPPVDLTNLAPEKLGKTRWFRLLVTEAEWREMWEALHLEDSIRNNPVDEPTGPPQLIAGEEAVFVVGLGERPRMDYGILFEPIESKFGEARYRLSIQTLASPPVEVLTRPARAWFVPTAAMQKGGLVIEDEHGVELARFDAPGK